MIHLKWITIFGLLLFTVINAEIPSNQKQSFLELDSRLQKLANTEHLMISIREIISKKLDYVVTKNLGTMANGLPDGNLFKYFFRILVTTIQLESSKAKNPVSPSI